MDAKCRQIIFRWDDRFFFFFLKNMLFRCRAVFLVAAGYMMQKREADI